MTGTTANPYAWNPATVTSYAGPGRNRITAATWPSHRAKKRQRQRRRRQTPDRPTNQKENQR